MKKDVDTADCAEDEGKETAGFIIGGEQTGLF